MSSFAKFPKHCDCYRNSFGLLRETVTMHVYALIHLRLYTCEDIQRIYFLKTRSFYISLICFVFKPKQSYKLQKHTVQLLGLRVTDFEEWRC